MVLKENQRIMLTKRLIRESLVHLLAKESIYKISIRELCENAGINRSTFYKYYGSQYDVLSEIETELLDNIQKTFESTNLKDETKISLSLLTLCNYLQAHKEIVQLLTNNNVDPDFPKKLVNQQQTQHTLYNQLSSQYSEEDIAYISTFITSGGYQLIAQWINSDCKKPAKEIAALIQNLVQKVCTNIPPFL